VQAAPVAEHDRVAPHDLMAERSVLGAVLVDNSLFAVAYAVVQPPHFYRDAHQRLWAACARLDTARQPIDAVTLRDALVASGDLERVGGMAEIAAMSDGVPRAVNVESYARIIRDKCRLRELIMVARQTLDEAFAFDDPAEILGRAESRLMGVGRGASGDGFQLASDWMQAALGNIERNTVERRTVSGVPTGIPRLDAMTRGFQPSNLVIIGARTGVGKTSLAMQMCLEASRHTMAAFVSLEMSKDELSYRAVAVESGVDAFRLQTGDISAHESALVGRAAARIGERRLAINDAPQTIHGLCADVRRLATRYGLGIVFVDYLTLVEGPRSENRTQEVSAISRRLKALAMELQIPVVALAQLSREAVKGNDRPQLHHLKESGSLEQDANLVLLLHRTVTPTDGSGRYQDGEEAELIVAKNRSGPVGLVKLQWRATLTKFSEQSRDGETEQERLA